MNRTVRWGLVLANRLLEQEEEGAIYVDLDGTIAHYNGDHRRIGTPIPRMVARVRRWIGRGRTVKIFTARASDPEAIEKIRRWLKKYELPDDLEITNIKGQDGVEFWDDRAVAVEKNTGRVLTRRLNPSVKS